MPISSRWRSISVVLPLLFSAAAALTAGPALARAPETAAVLETIDTGAVSRSAVEALLTRAGAGDAEAAEVAARLYDRGIGVKWDPPSALRWYTTAAIGGSNSAKRPACGASCRRSVSGGRRPCLPTSSPMPSWRASASARFGGQPPSEAG